MHTDQKQDYEQESVDNIKPSHLKIYRLETINTKHLGGLDHTQGEKLVVTSLSTMNF